jgi:hypothetical protein
MQTTALRVPVQNFQGGAHITNTFNNNIKNINMRSQKPKTWSVDFMQVNNQVAGASKGLLASNNSCKAIGGAIIEGGSSSSEENKRPSTV